MKDLETEFYELIGLRSFHNSPLAPAIGKLIEAAHSELSGEHRPETRREARAVRNLLFVLRSGNSAGKRQVCQAVDITAAWVRKRSQKAGVR